MKLTPAEERALLQRIEDRTNTAQDAIAVEQLLDEASPGPLMEAIREMTAAMTESAQAETATSTELAVWRERILPVLERLTAAEEQKAEAAKQALAQSARTEQHELELKKIRLREIVVPIVTALLGALSAFSASYFGG